jgi:hypothetical protein
MPHQRGSCRYGALSPFGMESRGDASTKLATGRVRPTADDTATVCDSRRLSKSPGRHGDRFPNRFNDSTI